MDTINGKAIEVTTQLATIKMTTLYGSVFVKDLEVEYDNVNEDKVL